MLQVIESNKPHVYYWDELLDCELHTLPGPSIGFF